MVRCYFSAKLSLCNAGNHCIIGRPLSTIMNIISHDMPYNGIWMRIGISHSDIINRFLFIGYHSNYVTIGTWYNLFLYLGTRNSEILISLCGRWHAFPATFLEIDSNFKWNNDIWNKPVVCGIVKIFVKVYLYKYSFKHDFGGPSLSNDTLRLLYLAPIG